MEIITLVENSCADGRLRQEFGLSLLVRCAAGSILFDMGASALFADNARIMGIDPGEVDCAVLSHAHYDHGGGLGAFLAINRRAAVHVGRGAAGRYFGSALARLPLALHPLLDPLIGRRTRFCRFIGLEAGHLADPRLRQVTEATQIMNDVFLLVDIGSTHPLPRGNAYLLQETAQGLVPDSFDHELIMVVREADGLVLFTGCGHRGIANMVECALRHFPGERLKAVVGGFHLALQPHKPAMACSRREVADLAALFEKAGVGKVLTGHCTGAQACSIFQAELGDKAERLTTGLRRLL